MDRRSLIDRCFQRGSQLTLAETDYRHSVESLLHWLIASDEADRDVTTRALLLDQPARATVLAKQAGTLSGMDEALHLLGRHSEVSVESHAADGSAIEEGQAVLAFSAGIQTILSLERAVLNLLGRLSGIATQTRRLVDRAGSGPERPAVAATRKTPWMLLDKKAVFLGGGLTHRLSLGDSILVKDNHLAAFRRQTSNETVEAALPEAMRLLVDASTPPRDFFEIEVENESQARAAISAFEAATRDHGLDPTLIIMLDNFDAEAARRFIRAVRKEPIYARILFEASGDITEHTLPAWTGTGVDVLSLGALTHSAKNFNLSMAIR